MGCGRATSARSPTRWRYPICRGPHMLRASVRVACRLNWAFRVVRWRWNIQILRMLCWGVDPIREVLDHGHTPKPLPFKIHLIPPNPFRSDYSTTDSLSRTLTRALNIRYFHRGTLRAEVASPHPLIRKKERDVGEHICQLSNSG